MQDLNDLYYFAKVVEAGGFAAAGRLLGIPKSRLSRRIAELEARLGARLLQRTTRQLTLTAVGERYLRHCQAMLLEAEMADEAVASMSSEPRGRLRVSCPVGMAQHILPELVAGFLAAHPHVQLEMTLVNRRVDLVAEGIDVALRVRELGDEDPLSGPGAGAAGRQPGPHAWPTGRHSRRPQAIAGARRLGSRPHGPPAPARSPRQRRRPGDGSPPGHR